MISYWLDEELTFNTAEDLVNALSVRGLHLWLDHWPQVWAIAKENRPWLVFESESEAQASAQASVHTGDSRSIQHYTDMWFIRVGDQFIYTANSLDEAQAFLSGLLVKYLLEQSIG